MSSIPTKIMSQMLSILALSTRAMKERRIRVSRSIQSLYSFSDDYGARKVYEEASGKRRGGECASKIGYADKTGESDDGGKNLGGHILLQANMIEFRGMRSTSVYAVSTGN